MVKAFRSLGVDILDLPLPKEPDELETLKSHGRHGRYQGIFIIDSGADHRFISSLKTIQVSIGIPWIIWFVDDPEGYGFPANCEPDWTIAFCWDKEICRQISSEDSGSRIPLIHLPLATDPESFFPEEKGLTPFPGGVFVGSSVRLNELLDKAARSAPGFFEDLDSLWQVYKKDVTRTPQTMILSYLTGKTGQKLGVIEKDPLCRLWRHTAIHLLGTWKRRELVSRLIGPGGGVFGDRGWEKTVGNLYHGQVAYGEELRRVYNGSAFVLDIRPPQAWTGLTQRIFDASACGRPVLAEYSPELEILFEPADGLSCFQSAEEAQEIKKHFFYSPCEIRKRAEKTREKVLSCHTYRHRAEEILRVLRHH